MCVCLSSQVFATALVLAAELLHHFIHATYQKLPQRVKVRRGQAAILFEREGVDW